MEALRNIYRNKGIAGFWAGWQPKVRRLTYMRWLSELGMSNVVINMRQLSELGMSNVTIDLKLNHHHH
jgi:ribosomal protein L20